MDLRDVEQLIFEMQYCWINPANYIKIKIIITCLEIYNILDKKNLKNLKKNWKLSINCLNYFLYRQQQQKTFKLF